MVLRRTTLRAFAAATLLAAAIAAPVAAEDKIIKTHAITTFGDPKYPADFKHFDYVNPDAPKGGEWSGWAFGGFDSIHPYTTKGRAASLSSVFYETLLEGSVDEVDTLYGLLAKDFEYPENKEWVIFNLRPEARFSDGTPLTAEDVVFSYELMLEKGLPSFRAAIKKEIVSAEVLGPQQVKFTFTAEAAPRDRIQSAGTLPIFSKKYYEESGVDFEDSTLTPAIGSGPYILDEIDPPRRVIYKRNPDYWGWDLPIMQGRSNFDRIRIEYYGDYTAAFEGFKAGTYTFRNEASSLTWATGYDFPAVDKGYVIKELFPDGAMALAQYFVLNLREEKFADPRTREAIGMMFNFEWSNATLFYGIYTRTKSFWGNSDMEAEGMPSEAELALLEPLRGKIPDIVFTEPAVVPPVQSENQIDRRTRRAAGKLLDEAGWEVGDDGMRRNAEGEVLSIEILNDSPSFDRIVNPYVENLRSIGIDAKHVRIDNAQMTNRERKHDFEMLTELIRMSERPTAPGLGQYFGSADADKSIFNKAGLKSEGVDALIEHVRKAKTLEDLTTAVHALDRTLRAYRFWVPQWHKPVDTIARFDIYGFPEKVRDKEDPLRALGELDFWWFDQEKFDKLKAAGAL
ncbi:extracellular solute-binding protein [Halovulum sp. GXIMD14793]